MFCSCRNGFVIKSGLWVGFFSACLFGPYARRFSRSNNHLVASSCYIEEMSLMCLFLDAPSLPPCSFPKRSRACVFKSHYVQRPQCSSIAMLWSESRYNGRCFYTKPSFPIQHQVELEPPEQSTPFHIFDLHLKCKSSTRSVHRRSWNPFPWTVYMSNPLTRTLTTAQSNSSSSVPWTPLLWKVLDMPKSPCTWTWRNSFAPSPRCLQAKKLDPPPCPHRFSSKGRHKVGLSPGGNHDDSSQYFRSELWKLQQGYFRVRLWRHQSRRDREGNYR